MIQNQMFVCLFQTIPEELKLTKLEERLVSPRLVFMQLREMPRGGQINLKGNIVNVPADVNNSDLFIRHVMFVTKFPLKFHCNSF
jgi:hypothetical protein